MAVAESICDDGAPEFETESQAFSAEPNQDAVTFYMSRKRDQHDSWYDHVCDLYFDLPRANVETLATALVGWLEATKPQA